MNEASIRDGIRRHYAGKALSEDRRRSLLRLLRRGGLPRRAPRWVIATAAAAVIAAIGVAVFLLQAGGEGSRRDALARAVAMEIARNHAKHETVEIETGDYETLREGLDRLDFTILASKDAAMRGLALTGARHCSLQGHVAAQVQLRDAAGNRITLYEVRDADTFRALRRESVEVDGLRVEIWHESGVLFGLARPAR